MTAAISLWNSARPTYTDAVSCFFEIPSKLPTEQYSAAKSRYNDFIVVHMASRQHAQHMKTHSPMTSYARN